jgi:hypothetical protein
MFFETKDLCVIAGYSGTENEGFPHEGTREHIEKKIPSYVMIDNILMLEEGDVYFEEEIIFLEE